MALWYQEGEDSSISREEAIRLKSESIKRTIASHREKMRNIEWWPATKLEQLAKMLEEESAPNPPMLIDDTSLDFTTPSAPVWQKSVDTIMDGLAKMDAETSVVMPRLHRMDPKKKREIMESFAHQEKNWDRLKIEDIKIDKEEVGIWTEFIDNKKGGFVEVPVLNGLENGEIARLTIDGFESFEIVKIRTKHKDIFATAVVKFVLRWEAKVRNDSYFISMPLVAWVPFSVLVPDTMRSIDSFKLRKIEVGEKEEKEIERKGFIQKFFDLFR